MKNYNRHHIIQIREPLKNTITEVASIRVIQYILDNTLYNKSIQDLSRVKVIFLMWEWND